MKHNATHLRYGYFFIFICLIILWEILGQKKMIGQGALPSLSAIFKVIVSEHIYIQHHLIATLLPASIGFAIGTFIAVVVALFSAFNRNLEYTLSGASITIHCIPAIIFGPILAISFQGMKPQIILSAILVYFPVMLTFLVGMKESDPRPLELIRAYGGSRWDELRFVSIRSALPAFLSGLQIAVPAAILGSMLAEFGSGTRWGLGSYLLGAMGSGNPAKIWAVALVSTFISAIGYLILGFTIARLRKSSEQVTIASTANAKETHRNNASHFILTLIAILIPFLLWSFMLKIAGVTSFIGKGPLDVFNYLVHINAMDFSEIFTALKTSFSTACIGLLFGLLFAFILAASSLFWKTLEKIIFPFSILFQAMPIVALVPIVLVLFGHGYIGTIAIAVLITFFPAFVLINQGLRSTPKTILDVFTIYNASKWEKLIHVRIPYAVPFLCSAAKLAVPQALLGVISAEWLATSLGIGNLLINAQSMMEYDKLWSISFIVVLISVALFYLIDVIENRTLKRYSLAN